MRPVNSMIEFKQIVGRGTRLFDGKEYFTIYDFVDAYKHFADPEWDGEPLDPPTEGPTPKEPCKTCGKSPCVCIKAPAGSCAVCRQKPCICETPPPMQKIKIKLRDGKEREIKHMISTSFWSADGKPISVEEFMNNMFGAMPDFYKDENELREIWANPTTRKVFLEKLTEAGYGKDELEQLQKMIDAENSDLFDVLAYVSFCLQPISRIDRVLHAKSVTLSGLNDQQKEFLEFVLTKYIERGVEELDEEKLPQLLNLKYHAIADAVDTLGDVDLIRSTFFDFQRSLYSGAK